MPSHAKIADRLALTSVRLVRWLRAADPSPRLSGPQASALAGVVHSGRIRMSDLARFEEVSRATITKLAAELQRLGLIERANDPDDGRIGWLTATGQGRRLLAEGQARRIAPLASKIASLSSAERAALSDGLTVLQRLLPGPLDAPAQARYTNGAEHLDAPKAIKEGVNKAEAEKIKKQIEEAGGTVELK